MPKRRIYFIALFLLPLLLWVADYILKLVFSRDYGLGFLALIFLIPIIFFISWENQHPVNNNRFRPVEGQLNNILRPSIFIIGFFLLLISIVYLSYLADNNSSQTKANQLISTLDIGAIQTSAVETAFSQIETSPSSQNENRVKVTTFKDSSTQISETENPLSTIEPTILTTLENTESATDAAATQNNTQVKELTPVETDIPEPIDLNGSGNDEVSFSKWDGPAVVSVTHDGDGTFELSNYSKSGQKISTLITTSGFYVGSLAIDFNKNQKSTSFHIIAAGDWEIQIIPLALARVENIPALIEGDGDDVIEILDTYPDQLKVDATLTEGGFTMWAYDKKSLTLLIRTTSSYSGTLIAPPGTTTIIINTIGPWSMDTTSK